MTTTQRKIRDAFATKIQAALPAVFFFRAPRRNLSEKELPAVCLFSHGDRPASEDDDHQQPHERVYTLRVEIRAITLPEEDGTDPLAIAVRQAILADDSLGLTTVGVHRVTWAEQAWDGDDGDPQLGGTYLDFNCYYTWRPE